ncbi:hypothetical protein Pint_30876 [Pistacia integerrima]|uniref:Uncharacterized protein n=1 Tax=Pistacia integerrima TaxID=434235 RepID=A0ACC0XR48_9ROSI|nr:hypothetical protein Pint_30876 [Pistacia integerrima]
MISVAFHNILVDCLSKIWRRFSLLHKLVNGLVVEADIVVCNALLSYFCEAWLPSHAVCGLLKGGRIGEASTLYSQMKEIGWGEAVYAGPTEVASFISYCVKYRKRDGENGIVVDVDLGWGEAVYAGPTEVASFISYCVKYRKRDGENGIVVPNLRT